MRSLLAFVLHLLQGADGASLQLESPRPAVGGVVGELIVVAGHAPERRHHRIKGRRLDDVPVGQLEDVAHRGLPRRRFVRVHVGPNIPSTAPFSGWILSGRMRDTAMARSVAAEAFAMVFEGPRRHVLDIGSARCMAGATPSQDWGSFMTTMDEDRDHLHAMGYAQELHRGMSTFSNFAISFSIISILAGGMTSFWLGMVTGGPRVIMIGWVVVGFFALLVGMAMGEICSAYPTAGGLYYWSAKLARKNARALVVVHRVLQPARPDRRHRLASTTRSSIFIAYFIRMFDDSFRLTVGSHLHHLPAGAGRPRLAQHVPRRSGQDPGRHQRLVARRRRGHHRRRAVHRPEQQAGDRWCLRRGASGSDRLDGWHVHHHLPLRARLAAGAVHHHRFRRVCARQ